jgi:hypothetical protein
MGGSIFGIFTFVAACVGIVLCKANKDGTKKSFLRAPGLETLVAILIVAGFGFGLPMVVAGVAVYVLHVQ